jgi:methylmalonyl-CoA mutase
MGNEYLVQLTGMRFRLTDILPRLQFGFCIGSSYFMEMAKLRAARFLWSRILEAYPDFREDLAPMYLLSQTSGWNQTLYDPHVNMLRATTSAMSAILGGTDSLTVLPYDLPLGGPGPSSLRIARNIQIILQEEAYLDKVMDPAAGSYYIENLTDTLINGAWKLFLKTEEKGGYQKSLIEGFIQRTVKETAAIRLGNLATRKEILLGTNQYPIPEEKAGNQAMEKGKAVPVPEKHGTIDPLEPFRAATEFEELRLRTENHGRKTPVAFIIPLGPLGMRRARAIFTINFFACAGFRVIDNIGKFKTVREGMDAARREGADIVVLCSADDEYLSLAGDLISMSGKDLIPVLAGYPKKHADALKKAGVKHFIHSGSNVLAELKKYQKLLGIDDKHMR